MTATPATAATATTHTPANDNRPADYDAKVVAYRPFIHKMARVRSAGNDDVEEVVADTMVLAFAYWRRYNTAYKFGTWLDLLVRNVVQSRKQKRRVRRASYHVDIDDTGLASMPNQDESAELARVLAHMPAGRNGRILMQIAMGEELAAIGADYGISKQRVKQIGEETRGKLRATLGMAEAA